MASKKLTDWELLVKTYAYTEERHQEMQKTFLW